LFEESKRQGGIQMVRVVIVEKGNKTSEIVEGRDKERIEQE